MFLKINKDLFPLKEDDALNVYNNLPLGTYLLKEDNNEKIFLEEIDNFELKDKLYGSLQKNTNKIIKTFKTRSKSTSVLLEGKKGTGKTLLSRNISKELLKEGISTIIVNDKYDGNKINEFLSSIKEEVLVIFDEFDKFYSYTGEEQSKKDLNSIQRSLFQLFEGNFQVKKYFIIIANEVRRISDYFLGRPGRVFYHIQYNGLEEKEVEEYVNDKISNKKNKEVVMKLLKILGENVTYDILDGICEEVNMYDNKEVSFDEIIDYMNLGLHTDEVENVDYLVTLYSKKDKKILVQEIKNLDNIFISDTISLYCCSNYFEDLKEDINTDKFTYNKKTDSFVRETSEYRLELKRTNGYSFNEGVNRFLDNHNKY